MKIVVTGGAGFIGGHVAESLIAAQHEVLVLDNLSSGKRTQVPKGAQFAQVDICSPDAAEAIQKFAPKAVVHLAAQMDVIRSTVDPMHDAQVNVIGTLNVLQAACLAGATIVVAASSGGAVYGDPDVLPATEATAAAPLSPYGVSKHAAELYMGYYNRSGQMRCVALRLANVYGPRQGNGGEAGVVSVFAQRMLRGEDVTLFGDGLQTRDFVYVGDVARMVGLALNSSFSGAVNVASNTETNLLELTSHLRQLTHFSGNVAHAAARKGEVRRSKLNYDAAQQRLGWKPETALFEGLRLTVADLCPGS